MIHYKRFTKTQAREWVESIDNYTDTAFGDLVQKWTNHLVNDYDLSYEELRTSILDVYKTYESSSSYILDLRIGLSLYSLLNTSNGFTNVLANDDDVWRYISCVVFPDITYLRYPTPAQGDIRLNQKRFYSHTRRIWLKTLWWYIHLSWQGSADDTYKILEKNTVDNINKLYEQPGKGFRLTLSRALMKEYSDLPDKKGKLFERIQKRNLVNCKTVEPALMENGESGYLKQLFEQLSL